MQQDVVVYRVVRVSFRLPRNDEARSEVEVG